MSSVNCLEPLDYLVLDYLRRSCDNSVSEAFQSFRKLTNVGPPGTTLEDLYSSNLKEYIQPRIQRDWNVQAGAALAQMSIFAQDPMPHLPQLVIENVLNFLPAKNIFQLRYLSREWNRSASESLRSKNRIPITFDGSSQMDKFLQIFEKRPQNWTNPFTAFHFYADRMDILPLLHLIGRDVKIGIFEYVAPLPHSQTHVTFFNLTPNIQELCFYGDTTIEPCQGLRLPYLRTLGLCKGVSVLRSMTPFESFEFGRSSEAFLDFEHLKTWMQIAPGLQELRLNFTVSVNCEFEFARFIQSRRLRHLSLDGIRLESEGLVGARGSIKNSALFKEKRTLELNLNYRGRTTERDAAAFSNFITSLADSITRCSTNIQHHRIVLPELRHCNYLKVGVLRGLSPQPITAIGFSNLRTVTLVTSIIDAVTHHHFTGDSFVSVETLQLVLRSEMGFTEQDWHVTFPRVTCLRVAAQFQPELVRYIWKHFAHVSHLHMCYTGEKYSGLPGLVDTTQDMDYSGSNTAQQESISKFKNLLKLYLEVEDEWDEGIAPRLWTQNIAPLLKRVVALTAAKRIQPLQHLTVFCTSHDSLTTREAGLFRSLRELDWHKKVDMIWQPEASHHKW